jgi:hypothetical protein
MKRAKKPRPQRRPPAAQMEIIEGIDINTFPLFAGSCPRVEEATFRPRPAERRPAVDLFGQPTRPTLEQLQRRVNK